MKASEGTLESDYSSYGLSNHPIDHGLSAMDYQLWMMIG